MSVCAALDFPDFSLAPRKQLRNWSIRRRHCERSEAIQRRESKTLDCFAALAMTKSKKADASDDVPAFAFGVTCLTAITDGLGDALRWSGDATSEICPYRHQDDTDDALRGELRLQGAE